MCGIAGIFGPSSYEEIVDSMLEAMAHRGPDGRGTEKMLQCAIGHTRLQVNGEQSQPIWREDEMLAFNGEIYNQTITKDSGGEPWWLLANIEKPETFDGMFAIAYYNRERDELSLIRDRYGIKPLYYTRVGRNLVFASEVKAFLSVPGFSIELDPEAIAEYWCFQNYLEPQTTIFKGVYMVAPGTILTFDANLNVTSRQFWDWKFLGGGGEFPDFTAAVSSQLRGNHAPGCYLSGGLDSAMIAKRMPAGTHTYSVGFLGGDERRDAEELAALLGTLHLESFVTPAMAAHILPKLAFHLEEPRLGASYPNWYAAELASRFSRVVMSGTGGDELFGGYPWRYGRSRVEVMRSRLPAVVDTTRPIEKLLDLYPGDGLAADLEFEAKTFLHSLLVIEDKLSMAHGLEARVPFLSNGFVDGVLAREPANGKEWMRAEMLPLSVHLANKGKQGFSAQDTYWFDMLPLHKWIWQYIKPAGIQPDDPRWRAYSWSLAYFSAFLRVWVDGELPQ